MESQEHAWGLDFEALFSYERNLPHWRQDGAIYFVTFRLKDSIPRFVMEAWREDRRVWLAANGVNAGLTPEQQKQGYLQIPEARRRAYEREEARRFFVELDECHGECVLRNQEAADIIEGALQFHHGTRLRCGDFVVMPNHVHWLLEPMMPTTLEDILHSVKRWSARAINKALGRTGALWQKESFDRIVREPAEYERTREYIAGNPAKARLRPGEFICHRRDLV